METGFLTDQKYYLGSIFERPAKLHGYVVHAWHFALLLAAE